MGLTKAETDLFDALRDADRYENFLLLSVEGRPVVFVDHSDAQDGSELEPIYGRLSDEEARRVLDQLEDEEGAEEARRSRSKPDRRWRG